MLVEAIQASLREADNNAALSGGIIDQQPTAHVAESSADQVSTLHAVQQRLRVALLKFCISVFAGQAHCTC